MTQPQVLSHYDEVKKDGAKLTLGQGGTARDGAAAAGGAGEEKTKVLESLKVDVKDASEYYTTEEMAKFKKPKKVRCKPCCAPCGTCPHKYVNTIHANETVAADRVSLCLFFWLAACWKRF